MSDVGRRKYFLIPPESDASFQSSNRVDAGVAQLVEHFLAKEDVASSSLVTRSSFAQSQLAQEFERPKIPGFWAFVPLKSL